MQPKPHGHENESPPLSEQEKYRKLIERPALARVDAVGLRHLRPVAGNAMWHSVGEFGNAVNGLAFRVAVIVVDECLLDSEDMDLLLRVWRIHAITILILPMQIRQDFSIRCAGYYFLVWVDADKLDGRVSWWLGRSGSGELYTLTSLIRAQVVMDRYHFHPRAFL
jgi:hypothetical protein